MKRAIAITGAAILLFCNSNTAQDIKHDPSAWSQEIKDKLSDTQCNIPLDSIEKFYREETIRTNGGGKYFKDQQKYKTGSWGKNLIMEYEESAEAQEELKRYRKKGIAGSVLYLAGMGGFASAIITLTPYGLLGIIPAAVGVIIIALAPKHLNKSIWLHNRDALLKRAKRYCDR